MRQPNPIWRDRDALHSALVALAALTCSCGLLYGLYLHKVWQTAKRAKTKPTQSGSLLVFGKRLVQGSADVDLELRLDRAHALIATEESPHALYLLGGHTGHDRSEARFMFDRLSERGLPAALDVALEDQSIDTLQNLRHARELLQQRGHARAILLSNRYHLARCALLARNLGLDHEVVAAEDDHRLATLGAGRLLREAAFLMWIDVGTRYARGLRLRGMLSRVT